MGTANYIDTFIAVAPDCAAPGGTPPREGETPSVALLTFQMIHENPYRFTSDDVIFGVWADRRGIPEDDRAAAREEFFSRGQACRRASDLGKPTAGACTTTPRGGWPSTAPRPPSTRRSRPGSAPGRAVRRWR